MLVDHQLPSVVWISNNATLKFLYHVCGHTQSGLAHLPANLLLHLSAYFFSLEVSCFLAARCNPLTNLKRCSWPEAYALIAVNHNLKFAIGIGIWFLIGGIVNIFMLPSPLWFSILDLVAAYIPMAYLGGVLVIKKNLNQALTEF